MQKKADEIMQNFAALRLLLKSYDVYGSLIWRQTIAYTSDNNCVRSYLLQQAASTGGILTAALPSHGLQ